MSGFHSLRKVIAEFTVAPGQPPVTARTESPQSPTGDGVVDIRNITPSRFLSFKLSVQTFNALSRINLAVNKL